MDGRIRPDNVIDLLPADVPAGTCRSCHAETIEGFQGHMLDCPVLTGEIAEVVPLFPARAEQERELESAYQAVFGGDMPKIEREVADFVNALRSAARHPNPSALVLAAKATLRAGFHCGFLFAKSRYGGGDG